MKIKILYEDTDILAVDKPSGILVHPAAEQPRNGAGPDKKTIIDIFKKKYPKMEVAHRLDRETSGVLLLAKNKKAYEFLKKQFQGRTIKKTYVAIVSGSVKNDRGIINKPIGRSPVDFRRYSAGRGARGKMREAITQYRVLGKFEDKKGNKFTYLEIHPKTGRTHQIRVHMKYLNHPVVCDSLYNPNNPCPKGLKRMALHAKSIEFQNLKGEVVKVESLVPAELKKVVK
ncbi:MAG: Pseudouridine synthase, RluA family [Candidatus Nomurabacteria bacterium GW2011_GWA2_43_15]|uniref:Pseudouridine synthase n=2 Tax=Candidatus Nomuraibacteriota TaxID=1752729 RepID=A0A0G1G1K3_9BACT|nr:MAG: Pseudouridine synthase, RluA family [Candidatus Nomurabacteria bacterium GW2011_GWA2_43_15]KKT19709.1 MAG: Pseudouridine synthase, RluA family [Candidatus Nomurabacteria bacterium GW2011_GWB1_43_7]